MDMLVEQILESSKTKGTQQRNYTSMTTPFLFALIAVAARKGIMFVA